MSTIIKTSDGSYTLESERFGESYHSTRGAVGESDHIFIGAALRYRAAAEDHPTHLSIFEVGFGTGLNCYLTMVAAREMGISISYYSIELYPIDLATAESYGKSFESRDEFMAMHRAEWGKEVTISEGFSLTKIKADYTSYCHIAMYDLIYFDAFSPETVPHMWSRELFERLYRATNDGGVITTYCSKGAFRRDLASVGFEVERLEGALGKRHMTRGKKI